MAKYATIKITNVHMRMRRKVRCSVGQGELFINRAKTKARIVDGLQAVHNYYCEEGEEFDLVTIQAAVKGLRLTLALSSIQQDRVNRTAKRKERKAA
jgi:hypothetical protein